jgi:hypothetical protein
MRPPFQVVSTTHTPSPTDGSAPVRISSERARSVAWMTPHSLIHKKLFAPPRACVPPNIVLVFASSCRTNFTASSPVFERVIGNSFLSAGSRLS